MSTIYTDPPQSRNEAIVRATIDGTQYTAPPQSRMEDLLLELKDAIEHGGGGTNNYEALDNKPQINDVELSGNKTASDLGLMPEYDIDDTPTEDSDNLITSGAVYEADEEIKDELQGSKTVSGNPIEITDAEPMNAESVVVELEPKQDLHGYSKPWAGGAGKNKLPLTVDEIKALNTTGTWNGNVYSINRGTVEILTDSDSNVVGLKVNGTFDVNIYIQLSDEQTGGYDFLSLNTPYVINGGVSGIGVRAYHYDGSSNATSYGSDAPFTLTSYGTGGNIDVIISLNTTFNDAIIYPMIRLSTESDPTFEPYSNICPISGYSEVNVENNTDTYTVSLGGTKYGGVLDVTSGVLTVTRGEIASYAGETLPSEWISDRDEYQAGTTPTTGAQVVYELATPTSVSTTPTDITLLETTNNISSDGTNIQLKYQPNNVIGECKAYTDEQVQKVLSTPPTTDGTYHLECSVSGGIPTIRWVLNS